MPHTFTLFPELPPEVQIQIGNALPGEDLIRLAMTSPGQRMLFKPETNRFKLSYFLNHLVRGEHQVVQHMLEKDVTLMCKRGEVTDYSGRSFKNISGFEYLLWALDKHGWDSLLSQLTSCENAGNVLVTLCSQYHAVKTDGVTYRLNDEIITEKHFDFKGTIIKELKVQNDWLIAPPEESSLDLDGIQKHWAEQVGAMQKLLPVHVVNEYCCETLFDPNKPPKPAIEFFNLQTEQYEHWFAANSGLGRDFAIYKGQYGRAETLQGVTTALAASIDVLFMQDLYEARSLGFRQLATRLEKQMSISLPSRGLAP